LLLSDTRGVPHEDSDGEATAWQMVQTAGFSTGRSPGHRLGESGFPYEWPHFAVCEKRLPSTHFVFAKIFPDKFRDKIRDEIRRKIPLAPRASA
jgi:hypothetical protein